MHQAALQPGHAVYTQQMTTVYHNVTLTHTSAVQHMAFAVAGQTTGMSSAQSATGMIQQPAYRIQQQTGLGTQQFGYELQTQTGSLMQQQFGSSMRQQSGFGEQQQLGLAIQHQAGWLQGPQQQVGGFRSLSCSSNNNKGPKVYMVLC
jgi:hypothetical protein